MGLLVSVLFIWRVEEGAVVSCVTAAMCDGKTKSAGGRYASGITPDGGRSGRHNRDCFRGLQSLPVQDDHSSMQMWWIIEVSYNKSDNFLCISWFVLLKTCSQCKKCNDLLTQSHLGIMISDDVDDDGVGHSRYLIHPKPTKLCKTTSPTCLWHQTISSFTLSWRNIFQKVQSIHPRIWVFLMGFADTKKNTE